MHHEPTSLFRKSFVGVVLFSLLLSFADAVVYVRIGGSDSGFGTETSPFATLTQALLYVSANPGNNEINLGKGIFNCPLPNANTVLQSTTITGNTTKSTIIQQGGSGICFRFYGGLGTTIALNTLTLDTPIGLSGAEIQNGAQVTYTNVELVSASYSPPILVRNNSRITLVNCAAYGLRYAQSIIGTEVGATVIISNSRFTDNKMWIVRGGGITLSITGCIIQKHGGVFDVSGSLISTVLFSGNEIFNSTTTYTSSETGSIQTAFACSLATISPTPSSGNRFCGVNINKFYNCAPILGTPTYVQFYDGCGRCGLSSNADKDCNGICFGPGTNCRNYTTLYASVNGTGTDCSVINPCSFNRSTQIAGYKDIVSLMPGEYALPRSNIFNGVAFTIKSYWNDPATVAISAVNNIQISGITINSGESFDSVFLYVTLGRAIPTMTISGQSAVTILNCIVREGQPGGFTTGGMIIQDDGYLHFNNSQYINTNSLASIASQTAAVVYVSASENHFSGFYANGSRFTNNMGGIGTVVANTNSQLEFRYCYFGNNANSNGAEVNILSATSWLTTFACIFVNPPNQTLICAPPSATYHPSTSIIGYGYSCGVGTNVNVNGNPIITRVNCPSRSGIVGEGVNNCGGCKNAGPFDCLGNCWGYAYKDPNGTNCANTQKDCFGMCFGGAVYDCFGTCGGNGFLSGGVCTRPPTFSTSSSSSTSSPSSSSTSSSSTSSTSSSSTTSSTSSTSSSTTSSTSSSTSSTVTPSSSSSSDTNASSSSN